MTLALCATVRQARDRACGIVVNMVFSSPLVIHEALAESVGQSELFVSTETSHGATCSSTLYCMFLHSKLVLHYSVA